MLQCPSCSSVITFSSGSNNIIVCACGKVLRLKESGSLAITDLETVSNSTSFIAPGASGTLNGKKFNITGRFILKGKNWIFNYWTIVFENGETSYLGEGYGTYTILKTGDIMPALNSFKINLLKLNDSTTLQKDEQFFLVRKNSDVAMKIEGEVFLPETMPAINILDLFSEKGNFITVIEFVRDVIRYYDTEFVNFPDLHITGLKTTNTTKTFVCLHCYKTLPVKANPFTISISCKHCGTHHFLDEATEMLKETGRNKIDILPDIEIGSIGTIKGNSFEVIGYSLKEENNADSAQWREYVLFNREEGFVFLSEYEGNWIYLKEVDRPPIVGKNSRDHFNFTGNHYDLYNAYSYTVISAIGEHPYDITTTSDYYVREYISPPFMWSSEEGKQEKNWFFGQHINHKEILDNFTFPVNKPDKSGIGMLQPTGVINKGRFIQIMLVALLLMIAIHMATGYGKQEKVIFEQSYSFNDSTNNITIVTPKFKLDKWKSNIKFNINAGVYNNWFELSGSLINTDNGKEYSFSKGVEYYAGYSEGEKWTEGSTSNEAYLTGITPGNYFLNLTGTRDPAGYNRVDNFSVTVTYDVRTDRNLLFAILIIAIIGAIQYYIFYNYNKKRWQNSRYSPYNYES